MGAFRGQFGGLNTDLPFGKVGSGTAREAVNVTVRNGQLQKRAGFSEHTATTDATIGGDPILNIFQAHFADGDVYLIAKVNDGGTGKLFYAQIYNGTTHAAVTVSWTELDITTNSITLSATDPGWAFLWRDRWHYFDGTVRGVRWEPGTNTGIPYKAGMPAYGSGPIAAAAANGEKNGKYHAHVAYRNFDTEEEGTVSGPTRTAHTGFCTTSPSASTGGIAVAAVTLPAAYEVDGRHAYCTVGATEHLEDGGNSVECFSFVGYPDAMLESGLAIGLNKADHVLATGAPFTNAGGLPPAAKCGTWTGQHALYGGLSTTGKLAFSIPRFPTSVPATVTYTTAKIHGGDDSKTVWPKPWVGDAFGFDGPITSIKSTGGLVALYTPTSTYQIRADGKGRLFPAKLDGSFGCVSPLAAAAAGSEIHSITNRGWTVVRANGIGNLAAEHFTATLADIPAGYQRLASMAYYGYHGQVWAAVVESDATVAQRILVWDTRRRALTIFRPACLGASEGINAMCEIAPPNETPYMLVATSSGRLLRYPDGTSDDGSAFAANWKGVFAVERSQYPMKVGKIELQTGDSCSNGLTWGVRVKRAGGDSETQNTGLVSKDNGLYAIDFSLDKVNGRMIEVDLSSTTDCTVQWTVHDVSIRTERTDLK